MSHPMTEHTPPTAARSPAEQRAFVALEAGFAKAQEHAGEWLSPWTPEGFALIAVAALRSSGVLPRDRPGAKDTIDWWRDLANNNQRQLDIVDDALGWKECGGGRIACVEELKRRSGVLPETPSAGIGVAAIAAERERQITVEMHSAEHDATHDDASLIEAAFCYIGDILNGPHAEPSVRWPWQSVDWKPTPDDPVRQLVKAGALIAAEIDRRAPKEA